MYPIEGSKLRVCAHYLRQNRNRKAMRTSRIILLEHMLPTTEALIYLLANAGGDIHSIIAKPYSIDEDVISRLTSNGFKVIRSSYDDLENTSILDDLLNEAIKLTQADGKKILIFEVGGYFAKPLSQLEKINRQHFYGVVEDTTFGHNRYRNLVANIPVPVVSVARSRLKEIEAIFVGRDAVQATDLVLREVGESITGRNAVVIGYGMIGKNIARALRAADLTVSVYDIRDHRNLRAFMMGFNVNKKVELIRTADFVFAATGWSATTVITRPALSKYEILDHLKDNSILVSVGSKDNEFDIRGLRQLAELENQISAKIIEYKLPNKKSVSVIKDGTAVNFLLPSIAVEVLDLVFSEVVLAGILLMKNPNDYPSRQVNVVDEKHWSEIAKNWLRFVNSR